jgi:cAMP-dependent protein kinase regulator
MLEEKEKQIVIDAMEEAKFNPGDFVIKQGDDGDILFLVDSGLLECTKMIEGESKFLLNYTPGMAFGE